jgi:hypothetical protein
LDAFEDCGATAGELVLEILYKTGRVDIWFPVHEGQKRLYLRGENDAINILIDKQRFDPQAVSGQNEALSSFVVQGESEHSVEIFKETVTIFLVTVDDHLGIGTGEKTMTSVLHLLPEFHEVIDFTVGYESEITIL